MIGLTEDQLYKLVWQLLVWLLGAFSVVATATWWAKGQLESSKINGLQARIKNAADLDAIRLATAQAEKNELIARKETSEQALNHQIENLKNLNDIAEQRRQFAEDQLKVSTIQLERIKSELAELKDAGTRLMLAPYQSLGSQEKFMVAFESVLKTVEASTNSALSANNQTGTILGKEAWEKPIQLDDVRAVRVDKAADVENWQESIDPEKWQESVDPEKWQEFINREMALRENFSSVKKSNE